MHATHSDPFPIPAANGRTNFPIVPINEVPAPGSSGDSGVDRPVVLVVDDKPAIADMVAEILNQHGYAAIAAYDGEDALETALLIPPELVIADVRLAGMSGLDVAAALKKKLPNCKVLLLSEQKAASDLPAPGNGVVHDFVLVDKPVHPADLVAQVSASLKSN